MPDPIEVSIVRNPIAPMRSTFEYDVAAFNGNSVPKLVEAMNRAGARGFQLVRTAYWGSSLLLFFEKWCPIIEEEDFPGLRKETDDDR